MSGIIQINLTKKKDEKKKTVFRPETFLGFTEVLALGDLAELSQN